MREGKARQGHGKPRQSKASLAMSCLALPGESLLSIERIRRLTSSIERRRAGKAWAWAVARQGKGKGKGKGTVSQGRARQALFYIERRETPSLHKGESVSLFLVKGMHSPSLYRIESVSTRYREERDVKARQGKPKQR